MSTDQNKAVVRRYFEEVWSKGNLATLPQVLDSEAVMHDTAAPEPIPLGRIAVQLVKAERTAFPDLRFRVEDILADGDKVMARWVMEGTQKGEYRGRPASGNKVSVWGIGIYRLSGGRIVEVWLVNDDLRLLQQVGLVESAG